MLDFSACAQATQLLSSFEPMAGAGLALALAYLALERFRYRSEIRKAARAQFKTLQGDRKGEDFGILQDTDALLKLKYLANLPNYDDFCPEGDEKLEDININDGSEKEPKQPSGWWGWLYASLYNRHLDRAVAVVIAVYCGLSLATGSLLTAGYFPWLNCAFTGWFLLVNSFAHTFSMALPALFVACGGRIVSWGKEQSEMYRAELEQILQNAARQADLRKKVNGEPPASPPQAS